MLEWLAFVLVVAGYLGVYSAWTAGRLDRMHRRLDAARSALDVKLRERAEVARHIPALREAAEAALAAADRAAGADHCGSLSLERQPSAMVPASTLTAALGPEREQAENRLSRALRGVTPTEELSEVVTRASFARQFHNDAVRDALVLRRRWIVRLLHLAGHAPRPTYFEIDDAQFSDVARAAAPYD